MIVKGTTSISLSCEKQCTRKAFEQLVRAKVSLQFPKLDTLTQENFQRKVCGNHVESSMTQKLCTQFWKMQNRIKSSKSTVDWFPEQVVEQLVCRENQGSMPYQSVLSTASPNPGVSTTVNLNLTPPSFISTVEGFTLSLCKKKENLIAHFWAADCLHFKTSCYSEQFNHWKFFYLHKRT